MVNELKIDAAIEMLSEENAFISKSNKLIECQPALIAYLHAEGFDILTEEEKDLLWYCTLVVYQAVESERNDIGEISLETIEEAEEGNYARLGDKTMKFSEVADIMFDGYEEEDLLAFAEDALVPDEEDFPTAVGRKVIFLSIKTVIDVITK